MKKGYRGPGRGLLMELLYRCGGMKQPEIGAMPGFDYSTVSIGRKRFLMMMEADPELQSLFTKANTRISQG
jgi:putative transposase